jgi:hypothetical protein
MPPFQASAFKKSENLSRKNHSRYNLVNRAWHIVTMATDSLLHMHPLPPSSLPAHPTLAPYQTNPPPASSFIKRALDEGLALATDDLANHFTSVSKTKTSPPATANVELLTRSIPASSLPAHVKGSGDSSAKGEAWFARRSIHEDKASAGSASWEEFQQGLSGKEHSVHESDYTPEVYDAVKVIEWADEEVKVDGYENVGLQSKLTIWARVARFAVVEKTITLIRAAPVWEMCHHIPPPLSNRIFAVVVVTAHTSNRDAFLVVQVPAELSGVKEAMYSNGRHKTEGNNAAKKKPVTVGQYTSVEYVKVVESKEEGKNREIIWEMATASDARGTLPMAIQKLALPGAVVKDVGWFIDWTGKRRKA